MDIVERLRNEPDLTPAQYWEFQADIWQQKYKEAVDEIERLRDALRKIRDGARDVEKSYAQLFAEVRTEARAAFQQKEGE